MNCDDCGNPIVPGQRDGHRIETGLIEDDRRVTILICTGCNERRWFEVQRARNTVPALSH